MKPWEETWEYLSGGYPADVLVVGTTNKVAEVWGNRDNDDPGNMNDSADLIAAAPELYRALADIVTLHHSRGTTVGTARIESAMRALSKARGEAT